MCELVTERLLLRRFRMADAEKVAAICDDMDVYRRTLALPHPYTGECARAWIAGHDGNFRDGTFFDFAVCGRQNGELYGCVGLVHNVKEGNAEIGYWVGKPYWNRGIATAAARALIDWAFTVKRYHKIAGRHFATNPASGRVMDKCGMVREEYMKEHIFRAGRYEDVVCYGIINPK